MWRATIAWLGWVLCVGLGCGPNPAAPGPTVPAEEFGEEEASVWMALVVERLEADRFSPPRASRVLGYSGVGIYEAVVYGSRDLEPLSGRLNGLEALPAPDTRALDFPTVVHGTMGHLLPVLFAEEESRARIAEVLAEQVEAREAAGVSAEVLDRSYNRGVLLAEVIAGWAADDGYGLREQGLHSPPVGDHVWVPTSVENPGPMEPFWGTLRPFAMPGADACRPPEPVPFSVEPDSAFYQEAYEVWEVSQTLTADQEHIARFWADDPGETATPPGHWMALARQMAAERELNLAEAAELYALVGITAADAFISCWEEKYRSYLVRPVTYIREHIDPEWETLIGTPPFPEYTSGHSNISGASAKVLTALLGEFPFEDRTHEGRGLGIRRFESFEHAAQEAAISRLYGGIHYPMGIDHGLPQGECVAQFVVDLIR